ncbi:hypothetical protein LSAT2_030164 [Lamellibrachia satsuma]|nr:hypothetical protein LSAT2_030164 [Lamellibrachia satsuma]
MGHSSKESPRQRELKAAGLTWDTGARTNGEILYESYVPHGMKRISNNDILGIEATILGVSWQRYTVYGGKDTRGIETMTLGVSRQRYTHYTEQCGRSTRNNVVAVHGTMWSQYTEQCGRSTRVELTLIRRRVYSRPGALTATV